MTNLYVDINVLQTVPSSNLNRDDAGAPKTALYGGVSRARVSSQSWKRAVRKVFDEQHTLIGKRTKKVPQLLVAKISELAPTLSADEVLTKVQALFKATKIKMSEVKDKENPDAPVRYETGALLMVSPGQIEKLAQYAVDHDTLADKEAVKDIKAIMKGANSIDLALFGRMVADNPELNVDASTQVAHALSTHEVVPEFDYYTAMDDEKEKDQNGAAMLGTIEYNSSTLYRYANVNLRELAHNLDAEDAVKGTVEFIKAFLLSMPSGKQNTFANKTLPSYIMVTLRPDTPVNLVSAFEEPVTSRQGFVKPSEQRLEAAYQAIADQELVEQPLLNVVLSQRETTIGQQAKTLPELLATITEALTKAVQDENTNV
ncbi:type I-E CRISPR-associated protein Cas7/Cse4/CasC [Lactiplantibacillus modestisalitolerans]|uniref:Type I-E CRISPR-associated protein Cas7/Cse4/CasC n=1 Tax=Lactiplantibacillus modestisalitolerans TaxID=1457219 RepID=A0ABV5WRJ0_9LACO|nr:type I-E CRISPR-associated protein Cas7/Cse4/CasC [Lactiplantibacillus modestisalitolerans]